MRRAAHHIALALSFVRVGAVFLGPGTGRAHACSCAGSPSPTDELNRSDAVFAREVIDVEDDTSSGMPPLSPVTLEVEESWKGVSEERIVVRGYGPEVSCGIEFREGERYLVYARDKGGKMFRWRPIFATQRGPSRVRKLTSPRSVRGLARSPAGSLPLLADHPWSERWPSRSSR